MPRTATRQQTVRSCLKGVRDKHGSGWKLSREFEYQHAEGLSAFVVLRFESADGQAKTFRPIHRVEDRWLPGDPQGLLQLYRLPDLIKHKTICVFEGEGVVEDALKLGLHSTTSAHGASSAKKTDWTPLAGKQVFIFPDADEAGGRFAKSVARILTELDPQPEVRIVALPVNNKGDDLVEFVEARLEADVPRARVRDEVLALAASAPIFKTTCSSADDLSSSDSRPFPLDALPTEVAAFCQAVAEARSVTTSVAAAWALAAMASAAGLSRIAYDEYADWEETPVIWVAVVMRSGARKTPVLSDIFGVHYARQGRLREEYEGKSKQYAAELDEWELKRKRRKKDASDQEPRPAAPELEHLYATDTTLEALVQILTTSPRGVLVIHDELSSFFGRMGAYSSGGAEAERGFWLSLFTGVPYKNDRAGKGSTFIPRAAASVVGGIQPGVIKRCFDPQTLESGLASRFLLVMSPPRVKEYRQGPSREVRAGYEKLIEGLFGLEMEPYSRADGEIGVRPQRVPVSEEARELLREFVPTWSEEAIVSAETVEAAMSKLEGYALRFALVLRAAREAKGGADSHDPILREDLECGIRLAKWFRDEAVRTYLAIGSVDEEGEAKRALEGRVAIIRDRHAGAITVREWHKRNTRVPYKVAREELEQLVRSKMAKWRKRPSTARGGAPTEECAVIDDEPDAGCGLRDAPETTDEQVHEVTGDNTTEEPRTPQPETHNRAVPESRELNLGQQSLLFADDEVGGEV